MDHAEVRRAVADRLDREATAVESGCRLPGGDLPCPDDGPVADSLTRGQWRDAGLARSLREAAVALRRGGRDTGDELELGASDLRVRSWFIARQLERDAAADAAMVELARCEDPVLRFEAVARSAYAFGRARGMRLASEIWSASAPQQVRLRAGE